ncbi:MAG: pyruvate, phosphate dikinase [Oscillospiraceae bacterium]|nr:pyruvate, phosphate dikinase [Oscillospiraceae bacterium]
MEKFVYLFSEAKEVNAKILGCKGKNLAEMYSLGIPVPPGFIITTNACEFFFKNEEKFEKEIESQIFEAINNLEKITGKCFCSSGKTKNTEPLLVSVRSGAKVSMPGMMDTILNLGINDKAAERLLDITGKREFVQDSYLRFIQMFSDVVMKISRSDFLNILGNFKEKIKKYKDIYKNKTGKDFCEEPFEQLFEAIKAIFRSWNNPRAKIYRKTNNIPDAGGTAVTVQAMVFGNFGENSGTGVAFSRNPITGEKEIFGEYLSNAQGEDIVAGIRTPVHIKDLKNQSFSIWNKLKKTSEFLEFYFKDMQDMEFTIENGKFYMLQTRKGKRSAEAAIKIALDMVSEKLIDEEEAVKRVEPNQISSLLHPDFEKKEIEKSRLIAKGLPAAPGAAVGRVVFDTEKALEWASQGQDVILVKNETSPEDIEGMQISKGILTSCGGMTSHAAVIARGMGKCCVVGCGDIKVLKDHFETNSNKVLEGDYISVEGSTGKVYLGKIKKNHSKFSENLNKFLKLADSKRKILVLANADRASDVKKALDYGAEGIGLCRTEHMFFESERINFMREMIIAPTKSEREAALEKLLKFQINDFKEIFKEIPNKSVVIRLLDPPLHEFLPKNKKDMLKIALDLKISTEDIKELTSKLSEVNPMMGHRGCRLLISYPEIIRMQTKAIILSAIETKFSNLEIMIPLIGDVKELKFIKEIIVKTADEIISSYNFNINYKIGTMIEIPRAAIIAGKIAKEVDFFSFGTNDLTQMTFGLSRDDSQKFLKCYYENGIYNSDPFTHIDREGVGELMKIAIKLGKNANPSLKVGVCGEHGGDSESIEFFTKLGVDYISCSPFRVPAARLQGAVCEIKNLFFE